MMRVYLGALCVLMLVLGVLASGLATAYGVYLVMQVLSAGPPALLFVLIAVAIAASAGWIALAFFGALTYMVIRWP